MQNFNVWTGFQNMVAKLIAATDFFAGAKVGLFVNDIALDQSTELADLTECAEAWYTQASVVNGTRSIAITADEDFLIEYPHVTFQPTAAVPSPQTLYGWFLLVNSVSVGPPPLLFSATRFDTPVILTGPTELLVVEVRVLFGAPKAG